MKLLILGAGFMQLNAIKKAKSKGHTVIVADYLADAPGKKLADFSEMTSTFDVEGNIQLAKKYKVDGILTIGTDQPVLTVAKVAESLGLPTMIDSETALQVTNKKYMKEVFTQHGIPSSPYVLIHRQELEEPHALLRKLEVLSFPIVIKPIDSQGQRGVFKVNDPEQDILAFMQKSFSFSRSAEIIVEQFCAGDEVTISAWVEDHHPSLLLMTDRPLLNVEPHLGIPDGHVFPSKYLRSHFQVIQALMQDLITAFKIKTGPVYVQVMIRNDHLEVVEIACRIGGGHEEELIPLISGIDPVDFLIEKSLGHAIDRRNLDNLNVLESHKHAMVKFIIAKEGRVQSVGDLESVRRFPGVVNVGLYNPYLTKVDKLTNSTCRLGYLLVEGKDQAILMQRTETAYRAIQLLDEDYKNMLCYTRDYISEAKRGE